MLTRRRRAVKHDRAERDAVGRAQLRHEFVERHSSHASPGSARAAAAETASASEASKASSSASAETAAASKATTAPPTSASSADGKKNWKATTPSATERRQDDEEENEQHVRRNSSAPPSCPSRLLDNGFVKAAIDLKLEFVREALGDAQRHQLDAAPVVRAAKEWNRLVADLTRRRIGDESFGAVSSLDADVPSTVSARLFWNDEDDDARVARRITRLRILTHLPLSADPQPDFFDGPAAEIGKRDDDDFATGFRAHVVDDALHRGGVRGGDDVREVVDVALRRRQLQSLQCDGEHRVRNEQQSREGHVDGYRSLTRDRPQDASCWRSRRVRTPRSRWKRDRISDDLTARRAGRAAH